MSSAPLGERGPTGEGVKHSHAWVGGLRAESLYCLCMMVHSGCLFGKIRVIYVLVQVEEDTKNVVLFLMLIMIILALGSLIPDGSGGTSVIVIVEEGNNSSLFPKQVLHDPSQVV